ncbi:MAG: NAD(P)/FAD-dependent oxidoreductase [Prevotella sp.]|nr:NAD(P)/FAD-dependent oxidoreductase [Prevotella sp.]
MIEKHPKELTFPLPDREGQGGESLIIIGAGPGGYRAAEYAAKQGLKVTIFESGEVGGTCLNVGCIPTKTYVHSASFAEARERMPQVVAQLRAGVESILSHPNITLIREKATFLSRQVVAAGNKEYTAPHIIIATGSKPKMLRLPDLDDPRLVTSTELLQMEAPPRRLAVIGAGVIGMEFASIFQRFGSEVTVIEYLKECLPMLDSDVAKRLRKTMEKRGIVFKMKTAVQRLADIDADTILMATGREANTDGIDFDTAGLTYSAGHSIPTGIHFNCRPLPESGDDDGTMTYAIGDVNGRQMLAHAAEMQGIHVVNHILGRHDSIRFDIMPAAIFTEPEAACVGPSEDQLKADGTPYLCKKAFWRANGKALAMGETEGMLKLFVAPPSQGGEEGESLILGCHAFGAHAADIIQEVSVLMCMGATVEQLRSMVHIHPTLSEILLSAAEA